ncbi:hypothetical protein [Kutzneria sp. 744]|nr:hypothetical protein [Kutzneria sp. 744]
MAIWFCVWAAAYVAADPGRDAGPEVRDRLGLWTVLEIDLADGYSTI